MQKKFFTDCVDIVGSACKQYDGEKNYISTGAVDVDYIVPSEVEQFDYINRPSRANLEVNKGDILFAKMQGTKKTLLINELLAQNVYSTGFCAVRPKEGILIERCLYHLVSSEIFLLQKDKNCSGATQKAITNAGLGKIMIKVPEYDSQEMLADELDKLAKIIKRRKSQLEKMDELIKARFVELFGDPVSNSKRLPIATLPELGEFGRGISKHRPRNDPNLLGGEYPLIQTGDVAAAELYITDYSATYSELGLKQSKMWNKGTLCITIAANIAKTAILTFDACFPDSVVGFMANERTSNIFIHYWFSFFQAILESQAPESAQKNINLKILSELKVINPSKEAQVEFERFVKQVDKSKVVVQKALYEAQLLFDSLMQEYFG
jgi:type I restriction enzyme S subunit